MGILPMSLTGVPPVSLLLLLSFCVKEEKKKQRDTGKMPVRLMGGTPMLQFFGYFFVQNDSRALAAEDYAHRPVGREVAVLAERS